MLLRYSANRGVNTFITMRRDRQHLRNELNRLAHIPNLRPLPGREEPKPTMNEQKQLQDAKDFLNKSEEGLHESESRLKEESVADIIAHQDTLREVIKGGDIASIISAKEGLKEAWEHAEAKPQEPTMPASNGDETSQEPTTTDEDDFVSFTDLKRHETYKPEDLPTPMLKELWEKNRDEYKELQHCHAQMKQANSDAGRADWRNKVIALRESISKRWKLFDEEMERVNTEKAAEADTQQKAYNPLNDRAYISKSLKKAEWDDARKLEVQHRVDALLQHNQTISEETKKALRERGITIE